MNKKATDFNAGIGIIFIIVYFVMFVFIFYAVENISNDSVSVSDDAYFSSIDRQITPSYVEYCNEPRYKHTASGEIKEFNVFDRSSLECSESAGVKSSSVCDSITGCTWDNVECSFWTSFTGCDSALNTCVGTIDSLSYGIESTTQNGRVVVAEYEISDSIAQAPITIKYIVDFLQISSLRSADICNHPKVLGNKELCEKFSCTWSKADINSGAIATGGNILRLTASVFTFSYDFGFSNSNLNIFTNFLFIGIPVLLLIIFIYLSIPFI